MKNYLAISILFFLAACSENKTAETAAEPVMAKNDTLAVKKTDTSGDVESKIMKVILDLPEVKEADEHIDSVTNHQHGVAAIIDDLEQGDTDYSVRVGYNGDERFEVYYFFTVNPVTLKVKILDVDSNIPIEDWRKKNKK
jgi:uncharacterized lipoprotein